MKPKKTLAKGVSNLTSRRSKERNEEQHQGGNNILEASSQQNQNDHQKKQWNYFSSHHQIPHYQSTKMRHPTTSTSETQVIADLACQTTNDNTNIVIQNKTWESRTERSKEDLCLEMRQRPFRLHRIGDKETPASVISATLDTNLSATFATVQKDSRIRGRLEILFNTKEVALWVYIKGFIIGDTHIRGSPEA